MITRISKSISIILAIVSIVSFSELTLAQQEPMFTQYMFNTVSVNPAYAGTTNSLNVNMLSRIQWVGMRGAPKTFSLAMHSPVINQNIGVGFTIVSDKIGPVRNNYFTANYAYRLKLNEDLTLSMGLKGGLNQYYVGLADIYVRDPLDEAFLSNERRLTPNLGFGFYLYSDKYYVGFSMPKIFQTSVDEQNITNSDQLKRHYYIIAGYVWQLNSEWLFKPSFIAKAVGGAPLSTDITAQFLYRDFIWVGAMYRLGDAAGIFFNFKISNQLTVGYGYDFSLSRLNSYNRGTHEIMLSFDFEKLTTGKVKSPRYF
ncbi:PorP/SprF family type IX secretion system membrane protein [Tenuifilum thalassicum]|uniref:Type IX secretion system membrane protein PorP/SprF n=1 Tax=Tenuifilum thalassicum TaxID=2590900 RepID=A0A7D3XF64_9BACT|nr:type IX secretion system membrane protein PorP/SprF [Tenuifilum thalassicum]QKG80547.1 type IX secretion system membrane protein PorP/SprF [Tenuifilum thalassicum]